MQQFAAQFSDRTFHLQRLVDLRAAPPGFSTLPQARLPVGIPVAMADPAAAKTGASRKTKRRVAAGMRERATNLVAQSGRNYFIRVEIQQPRLRGFAGGGIFLDAITFPRFAKNFRAELRGDFIRAISHVVVDDNDDFADPARDTVERAPDAPGFVAGDEADGNGQWRCGGHKKI